MTYRFPYNPQLWGALLPFSKKPDEGPRDTQGLVVLVGSDTLDVRVGATVMRNLAIAKPLTVDKVARGDIVGIMYFGGTPYVVAVLGHDSAAGDVGGDADILVPAVKNLRVVQATDGVRLEWDWGGTDEQRRELSYYEVDARLPGGIWGYDRYPVSEGTRQVHYSDVGAAVQCRVRAVDFRGNTSLWEMCSELLVDSVAPPAPSGFVVEDGVESVVASWAGPTVKDVADLAGYYLYYTEDTSATATGSPWTGTGNKVATIPAGSLVYRHLMPAGSRGCFNLTAFDVVGNEGDLASDSWLYAVSRLAGGPNLLTNSDFERFMLGYGYTDYWQIVSVEGGPTITTGLGYGIAGSTGIKLAWPETILTDVFFMTWPFPFDSWLTLNKPGEWATYSIYMYAPTFTLDQITVLDTARRQAGITNDMTVGISYYVHNGDDQGAGLVSQEDIGRVVDVGNGWFRLIFSVKMYEYSAGFDYLGFSMTLQPTINGPFDTYLDRAKLEYGDDATEWVPSNLPSATVGLAMDVSGIVVPDGTISLGPDGRFYSDLEPGADNVYDVGTESLRWRAVNAMYVSATDGVTSTGNIQVGGDIIVDGTVDGVDVANHDSRHERAGADEIDGDHLDIDFTPSNYTPSTTPAEAADVDDLAAHLSGIDTALGSVASNLYKIGYNSSNVTFTNSWTTVASAAITIPSGFFTLVMATANITHSSYSSDQQVWIRVYDGTNSLAISLAALGQNQSDEHGGSIIWPYASVGSKTFYLQAMRDGTDGTVRVDSYEGILTVLSVPATEA